MRRGEGEEEVVGPAGGDAGFAGDAGWGATPAGRARA